MAKLAGVALIAVLYAGCDTKNETLSVLRGYGISGITPSMVLHEKAAPALNKDYRNKAYFLVLKATEDEFNQFVATNRFVSTEFLLVPVRSITGTEFETWWKPPPLQTNCYLFQTGKVTFTTVWSNGRIYLYGRD